MPPSRRPGLSLLLVAGAVVLVISILIGQKIGDRVLLQTARRAPPPNAGTTAVPDAGGGDRGELKNWKRLQVVSVATDPAFPDPRVTPPPRPPAPPETPRPRATAIPVPPVIVPRGIYTSPPLPIPLVSHDPSEVTTEPPSGPTLSPEERANVAPSVNAGATPKPP